MDRLQMPVDELRGVGPKTAQLLHAAGLKTVGDLVYFLPRKHQDFTEVTSICNIKPGLVSVRGKITDVQTSRVRRGLHVTSAKLSDDTGSVAIVWFNQPYRAAQLQKDAIWHVTGKFDLQRRSYQIVSPSMESVRDVQATGSGLIPVYRQVGGLKTAVVRKIIEQLKPLITMIPETLPAKVVASQGLVSHSQALLAMHFPQDHQNLKQARERLAFEELFALLLAALRNKQSTMLLKSWRIKFDQQAAVQFANSLPFKLTDAQRLAVWEIVQNFEQGQPMNRLLQGDVGSGKTVVAGMAAYLAACQGYQTAIMAPTELLATQHAETLNKLLAGSASVGLLVGSLNKKQKTQVYDQIANGGIDIIVGTHALIQDPVKFRRLGFVVIDEQHRFGVAQRQQLLGKASKMPHMLAMTATPIPRSLQLTVYGELDISLLRQLPGGRKPIVTKICSPNSRSQLYADINKQIQAGRQAYVVCPLISTNTDEQAAVETELKHLKSVFKQYKVDMLHGKMPADQKNDVMARFSAGQINLLVSTTVVEVGVDVPNATVMVIEGAEKFGLAQLHQLRGRVGRSSHESYCYLVTTDSKAPSNRLRELEKSNDGFYLAERDLEIRGPGEIYGKSQSGQLNLAIANLADTAMLKRVRIAAEKCIKSGEELVQYEKLSNEVERYQRLTTLN